MDVTARARADTAFNDRYELCEKLGEGGMGSVHRGLQRVLNRPVAIKFMAPDLSREKGYVDRFLAEARLAASLVHGSVVAVFDFGVVGEVPYLVTEFIPGQTLADTLRDRPELSVAEVLGIARGVLDGLSAIHKLGIVHRDIKPANLLVMPGNPPGVKILDFGIAKQTGLQTDGGEMRDAGAPKTATGLVMGTPEYMAPEQAAGDTLTPAADIYAFTLVLFRMITGHHPFRANSALELLRMQIHAEPAIPDAVLPGFREVLVRGLAKRPTDRVGSAEEMRALIDRAAPEAEAAGAFLRVGDPAPAASSTDRLAPPNGLASLNGGTLVKAPAALEVTALSHPGPTAITPAPPPPPGATAKSVGLSALVALVLVFLLKPAAVPPADTWNHDWAPPFVAVAPRAGEALTDVTLRTHSFHGVDPAKLGEYAKNVKPLAGHHFRFDVNLAGPRDNSLVFQGFEQRDGNITLSANPDQAWLRPGDHMMEDDGGIEVEYGQGGGSGTLELQLFSARHADRDSAVIYALRVNLARPGYEVMVTDPERCTAEVARDRMRHFHFVESCWRMISRHEVPGLNKQGTAGFHVVGQTLTVNVNGTTRQHALGESYGVKPGGLYPFVIGHPQTAVSLQRLTLSGAIKRSF